MAGEARQCLHFTLPCDVYRPDSHVYCNEAIALAYLSGKHTMAAFAAHFAVHHTAVSRLVRMHEDALK